MRPLLRRQFGVDVPSVGPQGLLGIKYTLNNVCKRLPYEFFQVHRSSSAMSGDTEFC